MWVSAATYCSILAPKNLLATLIGILGMAHFSLGNLINAVKYDVFQITNKHDFNDSWKESQKLFN